MQSTMNDFVFLQNPLMVTISPPLVIVSHDTAVSVIGFECLQEMRTIQEASFSLECWRKSPAWVRS